jgi:hypothetical protein
MPRMPPAPFTNLGPVVDSAYAVSAPTRLRRRCRFRRDQIPVTINVTSTR